MFLEPNNKARPLNAFFTWGVESLVESMALLSWALMQWVVNYLISYIPLTEIDQLFLITLQILLAIITIIPIIAHLCVSVTENLVETRLHINRTLKKLKENHEA